MAKKLSSPEAHWVRVNPGRGAKFKALRLLVLSDLVSLIDKTPLIDGRLRDILPEPFDWFDHAGNFITSIYTGTAVSYMSALAIVKFSEKSSSSVRRMAVGAGVASVAFANVLSETKWGVSISGTESVPDYVDIAYGVAAGTFAVSLLSVEQSQNDIELPAIAVS